MKIRESAFVIFEGLKKMLLGKFQPYQPFWLSSYPLFVSREASFFW